MLALVLPGLIALSVRGNSVSFEHPIVSSLTTGAALDDRVGVGGYGVISGHDGHSDHGVVVSVRQDL